MSQDDSSGDSLPGIAGIAADVEIAEHQSEDFVSNLLNDIPFGGPEAQTSASISSPLSVSPPILVLAPSSPDKSRGIADIGNFFKKSSSEMNNNVSQNINQLGK